MRCIGLYKIKDFFILNPMEKTTTGGLIGSMNFVKMPDISNSEIICHAIEVALEQYRENVLNPTDWKKFSRERNAKLKTIGVSSESDLNKIGNKFCLITEEKKNLEIIPSKNDVAKKYFAHLPDFSQHIELNNDYEKIIMGLEMALAKCL